jgi:hypothetical protein
LVIESGGLMSTAERYRQGISVQTTTPAGDIRSGVDHVLFGCMGESQYGNIKIVYKDQAYLRRDVLITNRDFGPQQTRYPSYRKYHNSMRKKADMAGYKEETNTNPYKPLSPRARQAHINGIMKGQGYYGALTPDQLNAGNNEWNIAHVVPVEDWAYVMVPDEDQRKGTEDLLQKMLAEGRISEAPRVIVSSGFRNTNTKELIRRVETWTEPELPTRRSVNATT